MSTNDSSSLMHAVAIEQFGGVEEISLMKLPIPSPGVGVSEVIDYNTTDFVEAVRFRQPNAVDAVLTTVGGETKYRCPEAIRNGGQFVWRWWLLPQPKARPFQLLGLDTTPVPRPHAQTQAFSLKHRDHVKRWLKKALNRDKINRLLPKKIVLRLVLHPCLSYLQSWENWFCPKSSRVAIKEFIIYGLYK